MLIDSENTKPAKVLEDLVDEGVEEFLNYLPFPPDNMSRNALIKLFLTDFSVTCSKMMCKRAAKIIEQTKDLRQLVSNVREAWRK